MNGNSIVNTANTRIADSYTNSWGFSNSTGILTLNDSAKFNATGAIIVGYAQLPAAAAASSICPAAVRSR